MTTRCVDGCPGPKRRNGGAESGRDLQSGVGPVHRTKSVDDRLPQSLGRLDLKVAVVLYPDHGTTSPPGQKRLTGTRGPGH